jgi:hypothetical protein
MSKKDFIALADYIRTNREAFGEAALSVLADFCQSQNGRFLRDRWLAYIAGTCGPSGGEIKRK